MSGARARAAAVGAAVVAGVVGGVLLTLASACGPFVEEPGDQGGAAGGRICYSDSECVPAGCCGQAIAAIHVLDAQSCANVRCSGTCPSTMTHCGCGIPVCRDGSCTVALRHDDQCP